VGEGRVSFRDVRALPAYLRLLGHSLGHLLVHSLKNASNFNGLN
jgi:hypothetical protein